MDALTLLVLALACWRLTVLLARDQWPLGVGGWLRARLPFLTCAYCASVWAAAGVLLVWQWLPMGVYLLAVSGGAMLLHRYTGGDAW